MAPKPTRKNLPAGPDGREPNSWRKAGDPAPWRDPPAKPRISVLRRHFIVRLQMSAPEVVDEFRGAGLDIYRQATTQQNPYLSGQPISTWPWCGQADDEYPPSARVRLVLSRWAARRHLLNGHGSVPPWFLNAIQGALELWLQQGSSTQADPLPMWLGIAAGPWEFSNAAKVARKLDWFIRWQVQERKWPAIRQEFDIKWAQESALRTAVARVADELGFVYRLGGGARPRK